MIECDDEYQEERGIPAHGRSVYSCALLYMYTCVYSRGVLTVAVMEKFPFSSVPFKRNGNGTGTERKYNGRANECVTVYVLYAVRVYRYE